jgi:hypothetical protein
MPWLPRLPELWENVISTDPGSQRFLSGTVLLALMASIAMDTPSSDLAQYRYLQPELDCIVHVRGQELIFIMPRDDYFLTMLELTHNHRPLLCIGGQQAAAHSLSGNLYATLGHFMSQRLGLDMASDRLSAYLQLEQNLDVSHVECLVLDILRWCATMLWRIELDLEEVAVNRSEVYTLAVKLEDALDNAAQAISQFALDKCFFYYHRLRYQSDDLKFSREMTADWTNVPKLSEHLEAYLELRSVRKTNFDDGLTSLFFSRNRVEEGVSLSQLIDIEQSEGSSTVIGIAMFYAIMSDSSLSNVTSMDANCPTSQLSRIYTERVDHEASQLGEASQLDPTSKTAVGKFLHSYGDMHIDALEKRL